MRIHRQFFLNIYCVLINYLYFTSDTTVGSVYVTDEDKGDSVNMYVFDPSIGLRLSPTICFDKMVFIIN